MSQPLIEITAVRTAGDLQQAIALFKLYAASLNIDLTFQEFTSELASLPGKYAPPTGTLLLARKHTSSPEGGPPSSSSSDSSGEPFGCVALRPLVEEASVSEKAEVCEMKRLYVSPAGRGMGVGRKLAEAVIAEARRLGYGAVRLDTLPSMTEARKLYDSLGFREVEQYYKTPIEGTVFLELGFD